MFKQIYRVSHIHIGLLSVDAHILINNFFFLSKLSLQLYELNNIKSLQDCMTCMETKKMQSFSQLLLYVFQEANFVVDFLAFITHQKSIHQCDKTISNNLENPKPQSTSPIQIESSCCNLQQKSLASSQTSSVISNNTVPITLTTLLSGQRNSFKQFCVYFQMFVFIFQV